MRPKMILSIAFGAALSVVTLYLAFRNVPLKELTAYLRTFNYVWLIPTVGLVLLTFVLRVARWRIILRQAQPLSFGQAFHPLMIGFMMNSVLPGRVGEIARPVILRQRHGLPITTGLATVAAERIFDIVMLMALFALVFGTLSSQPELEVTFGATALNQHTLQTIAWAMIRLILLLFAGLVLLLVDPSRRFMVLLIHRAARIVGGLGPRIEAPAQRAALFLTRMIDNVALVLSLVRHPRQLLTCLLITVSIWGATLLSYYIFSLGCPDIKLTLLQWTTLMVVICFFIALPSVPGYWGLWEAGGVFALSLFGVAARDAAGFTLLNHAAQLFPVIIVGWISTLATSVNIWQVSAKEKSGNTP